MEHTPVKIPMYRFSFVLLLLLVLNFLDYVMTIMAISVGGIERNPLSKNLIDEGLFTEVKLGLGTAVILTTAVLAYIFENRVKDGVMKKEYLALYYFVAFMVLFYVLIVINNFVWWMIASKG